MIDYTVWKRNIYSAIKAISDNEYQEIAWLGKSKDVFSSFEEDIMMLYDSFCFKEEFWEENHLKNFDFEDKLLEKLIFLKTSLDNYLLEYYNNQPNTSENDIIIDPKWIFITDTAKEIVNSW